MKEPFQLYVQLVLELENIAQIFPANVFISHVFWSIMTFPITKHKMKKLEECNSLACYLKMYFYICTVDVVPVIVDIKNKVVLKIILLWR